MSNINININAPFNAGATIEDNAAKLKGQTQIVNNQIGKTVSGYPAIA